MAPLCGDEGSNHSLWPLLEATSRKAKRVPPKIGRIKNVNRENGMSHEHCRDK